MTLDVVLPTLLVVLVFRLIINFIIYRKEYQVADNTHRRNKPVLLFLLSLLTILWLNYANPKSKWLVIVSNLLSIVFLSILAIYLITTG
ncbi:hypothetical protein E1176_16135 [Fulvivirga sp. RKSG066]|uniref:hypothetical protein n=1 Tax=Fulvivirga aurantia TaxID=2529383 RepID=UPI0016244630|nr:hypothetical protein [Fulvivirga aurantia]MTI22562.1 hypothetical protein [Fulvivirga aurantia]